MNNRLNGYDFLTDFFERAANIENRTSFSSVQDFEQYRLGVRERLARAIGLDKMLKTEPNPRYDDIEQFDGYKRQRVVISTQPKLDMPLFVLLPDKANGRGIIANAGHGCFGKKGLTEPWQSESNPKYHHTYAIDLVKKGYTVFVPDLIGVGERKINGLNGIKEDCTDINNACIALGISIQGLNVFDLQSLTDFIKKEYSFSSLGEVGFSAGGFASIMHGIFDERIEYLAVSGFFHSFKDVMLFSNKCGCNYAHGLWQGFDMGMLAGAIAPRALYFETGTDDRINGRRGIDGVYEQLRITQAAYKPFGKEPELRVIENGSHMWFGTAYDFIDKASQKK